MNYGPYDSSGTDDDLPLPHQNRVQRGGRVAGNGRPTVMNAVPYGRMYDDTDMETQIHLLEQEAYSSVLRAFRAQADALTWEKESLMTELRKELRLSNEEHRELMNRVNTDDVIIRIRDWRQSGGHQPAMLGTGQAVREPIPSPSVSASRKKQKMVSSVPSQSYGGPTPPFPPQPVVGGSSQPSSSTIKRGPVMGANKGKKSKSSQIVSGRTQQPPSSGPPVRGQQNNRVASGAFPSEPAQAASYSSLMGRRVRTRWPDDNNFYEAVITDFDPDKGRHVLVYDMGTKDETWEWVNISEISPEDIQWVGEDPGISRHVEPGHVTGRPAEREGGPASGRGRGIVGGGVPRNQAKKDLLPSQNGIRKKGADEIQILHTDSLVKEVERVLSNIHPNPSEVEKAKKALRDQEQALTDAIAKLADISDGESGEGGRFLHGKPMEKDK